MDRTTRSDWPPRTMIGWKWGAADLQRLFPLVERMAQGLAVVEERSLQQVEPTVQNPDSWRFPGLRCDG